MSLYPEPMIFSIEMRVSLSVEETDAVPLAKSTVTPVGEVT